MEDTKRKSDKGQTRLRPSEIVARARSQSETKDPSTNMNTANSIVEYYGAHTNYCGYCKRDESEAEGRESYDMKAHVLRADDYQRMLDRGWRRCGNYCYCPINSITCCPNYPISCEALKLKLSRSQRRCIENLNSFLVNGKTRDRLKLNYSAGVGNESQGTTSHILNNSTSRSFDLLKKSPKARDKRFVESCERKVKLYNITLDEAVTRTRQKSITRQQRLVTLEDYLYPKKSATSIPLAPKRELEIRMHYVDCKDSQALRVQENELMQRYQESVHKEDPSEWTMSRYHDFLINSPLIVEPVQQTVSDGDNNNDDTLTMKLTNPSDYLLVKPPARPTAYGTYHCVYYLDGKMIAVGVLDVLPKCITTVYFFYEPEYGFLNLGTYSALVEISMVRQMYKIYSSPTRLSKIIYYYLGFYVHECKKMHYKTKFSPSHILCSETYRYVPTEDCLKLLDNRKYSRFYLPEAASQNNLNVRESNPNEVTFMDIPVKTHVIHSTNMIDYLLWLDGNLGQECVKILVDNILVTYCKLMGPKLVPKVYLQLESIQRALSAWHRKRTSTSSRPKSSSQ